MPARPSWAPRVRCTIEALSFSAARRDPMSSVTASVRSSPSVGCGTAAAIGRLCVVAILCRWVARSAPQPRAKPFPGDLSPHGWHLQDEQMQYLLYASSCISCQPTPVCALH